MPDGLLEKTVGGVIRGITGLIVGSGGYQLFDGRWFGETIFRSFLQTRTADILTGPTSTELYGLFAARSVPESLRDADAFLLALSLFVGLVALAHVISKPSIGALAAKFPRPSLSRAKPSGAAVKTFIRYLQFIYVTYQPLVTVLMFLLLTAIFFGWPFQHGLALAFLIAVIPAALYLLLYPTDLSNGGFLDRFAYVSIFALLVVTLFGWPQLYGAAVFDPDFPVASPENVQDHCDPDKMEKGPIFVASETSKGTTLFRLCYERENTKRKYVDFISAGNQPTKLGRTKLGAAIDQFEIPVNRP